MTIATTLAIKDRAVGRFHKGPLQIHVDIAAHRSKADLAAAGVLPCHQPGVARQLLGWPKRSMVPISVQITTARISPTPAGFKPVSFSTRRKDLLHLSFNDFEILFDVIQLIEHTFKPLLSMGRKPGHKRS